MQEELAFHASVMQTAMLTGEQIVIRGTGFRMANLPLHVFPTDPRRPFHVDPVVLAMVEMQGRER